MDDLADFRVGCPLLWLSLAAVIVYFPSFFYGLTELDDFIFIQKWGRYNDHWFSLVNSFHRGVFEMVNGHFYRPVFVDAMIMNYRLCGQHVAGYHIVNVGLHIAATTLLYQLYIKLGLKELHAFILCLLFAVLPVLSQAVAWIPGRNDTLLAIFLLSYFLYCVNYSRRGKVGHLLLSGVFLLLACFTKESAVFAPVAAVVINVTVLQQKWYDKRNINQYIVGVSCLIIWATMRSTAHLVHVATAPNLVAHEVVHNSPMILQYIGKVFLPFNLNVYPSLQHSTCVYGIISVFLVLLSLYLSKEKSWRVVACGWAIFLVFLLPVLLLPYNMGMQAFEHRLYLPVTGLLLTLPQTVLIKNKLKDKQLLLSSIIVTILFAGINIYHQRSFKDPVSFWSAAMKGSPEAAHPVMVLASKDADPAMSYQLFMRAYALSPKEKFLNFCRGVKLQEEDSVLESVPYLIAEQHISNYYECDYYLARAYVKNDQPDSAISYLHSYIARNPDLTREEKNRALANLNWQQPEAALQYAKLLTTSLSQDELLKQLER